MTQFAYSFHGTSPSPFILKAGAPDATFRIDVGTIGPWPKDAKAALLDANNVVVAEWRERRVEQLALPDDQYHWLTENLVELHIQISENDHSQENLGHAPNPPATQASPFSQRHR